MAIIRKIPWTRKPPEGIARIAPRYKKNTIACWIFDHINGIMRDISGNGYDALSGNNSSGTFTPSGSTGPAPSVDRWGKNADFDGVQDCFEITSALPVGDRLQRACSFLWIGDFNDTGDSDQRIIDKSNSGNAANGWQLETNPGSSGFVQLKRDGSRGNFVAGLDATRYDGLHVYCMTSPVDGVTAKAELFQDGVDIRAFEPPNTDEDFTSFADVSTGVRIGTWNHLAAREWNGTLSLLAVFDDRIPDVEARYLSLQPWSILDPRTIIIPVVAPAPVGGRIMSSLAYYGGLAHKGGIAGKGGGLAG